MKQLIFILIPAALYLSPNNASSQNACPRNIAGDPVYSYDISKDSFSSNVPLNEISVKAFRYLLKNYPAVINEKWQRIPDGFMVVFEYDSILTRLFYTRNGDFVRSVKSYNGSELVAPLKSVVTRAFPEYELGLITENFDGRHVLYGVIVTKGKQIKTFELSGNEIKNVQEFDELNDSR